MSFASRFAALLVEEAPRARAIPVPAPVPAPAAQPVGSGRKLETASGREVRTTMSDREAVVLCRDVPADSRRKEFVESMLSQLERRGHLSSTQWAWVHIIAQEQVASEMSGIAEGEAQDGKGLEAIIAMFDASAANGLKRPRIVFGLETGEVRFTRTSRGKEPGSVCVEVEGEFAGRIGRDGGWTPRGIHPGLDSFIVRFAADPWGVAAKYGQKSGKCCFCARKLTDAREKGSLEMGYGPICAARYGKPHRGR